MFDEEEQYVRPNPIALYMNKQKDELACAEVLASLGNMILAEKALVEDWRHVASSSEEEEDYSDSPYHPSKSYKKMVGAGIKKPSSKKSHKKQIQRNTNACPEHRRKHQKCPLVCPNRNLPPLLTSSDESS